MIKKIQQINNKLIKENKNNESILKKQILIKQLLQDENCFFKIDIETAYAILNDLQIPKELWKKVYSELVDIKNYHPDE